VPAVACVVHVFTTYSYYYQFRSGLLLTRTVAGLLLFIVTSFICDTNKTLIMMTNKTSITRWRTDRGFKRSTGL